MRFTELQIQNYRGLQNVAIPMSSFGCLIGENNAGKSSVLQAIALFFSGTKLANHNYYDPAEPVRIQLDFAGITSRPGAKRGAPVRPVSFNGRSSGMVVSFHSATSQHS